MHTNVMYSQNGNSVQQVLCIYLWNDLFIYKIATRWPCKIRFQYYLSKRCCVCKSKSGYDLNPFLHTEFGFIRVVSIQIRVGVEFVHSDWIWISDLICTPMLFQTRWSNLFLQNLWPIGNCKGPQCNPVGSCPPVDIKILIPYCVQGCNHMCHW